MRSWYDNEIGNYDWTAPSFSEADGHFTQVMSRCNTCCEQVRTNTHPPEIIKICNA